MTKLSVITLCACTLITTNVFAKETDSFADAVKSAFAEEQPLKQVDTATVTVEKVTNQQVSPSNKNDKLIEKLLSELNEMDKAKKQVFDRLTKLEQAKSEWDQKKSSLNNINKIEQTVSAQQNHFAEIIAELKNKNADTAKTYDIAGTVRGKAWLRDQNSNMIIITIGSIVEGYGAVESIEPDRITFDSDSSIVSLAQK